TLTELAACAPMGNLNVVVDGHAELASGFETSGTYFRVLQINAAAGRVFGDDDDKASASMVAVISDAYWQKRFARDPKVINKVVTMNGMPVTIIGVTPPAFTGVQQLGGQAPDVTIPVSFDTEFNQGRKRLNQPTYWWLQLMGRRKAGVTIEQVR